MAVYGVQKGELVQLAETLEQMLSPDLARWEEYDDLLRGLGMSLHAEVGDAYKLYRRHRHDDPWPEGKLPGVKFMFDLSIDGDSFDYILIDASLPNYLAVLRLLEPLVNADKDCAARAAAEIRAEMYRTALV